MENEAGQLLETVELVLKYKTSHLRMQVFIHIWWLVCRSISLKTPMLSCMCTVGESYNSVWAHLFLEEPTNYSVVWYPANPSRATMKFSPTTTIEGGSLTLICMVTSNSVPETYHNLTPMEYTWQRNGIDLNSEQLPPRHALQGEHGSSLVISQLDHNDHGSYSCWGQEEGSGLKSEESEPHVLDVLCEWLKKLSIEFCGLVTKADTVGK